MQRDWDIRNGSIHFQKESEEAISKDIPSHQLITQTLGYARELERIV
jgi:26S proteasome regulatory subunit N12